MIYRTIHLFFVCYTVMLFIRVMGSWVPHFQRHTFMRFIAHYTDPYLNVFRRILPPLGGMIDLSPLLAFFALRLLELFLLNLLK